METFESESVPTQYSTNQLGHIKRVAPEEMARGHCGRNPAFLIPKAGNSPTEPGGHNDLVVGYRDRQERPQGLSWNAIVVAFWSRLVEPDLSAPPSTRRANRPYESWQDDTL
jgi:hypothetical protein